MEQNSVVTPAPAGQGVKNLSWKGIIQVFYQPAAFFDQLKSQPRVLVPYIIVVVLFVLGFVLLADITTQMQIDSPEMAQRLQGQPVTPQIRSAIKITSIVFPSVFLSLYPLLAAGLAMFVGSFVMGGEARFKQVLSVILYGTIVYVIGFLIHVPLILAKGAMGPTLSLGVLAMSQGPQSVAYVALSKIGLFNIWEIIVAGIGLAAINKFPRNKGYWTAVISIGLLSVLHVVLTWVQKMFA